MMSDLGRRLVLSLAFGCLTACGAAAETEAQSYGIGISPAHPQDEGGFGGDVTVTAALELERTDAPAAVVERSETIRLVTTLTGDPDVADRRLKLTCTVTFIDAIGNQSEALDGPCFSGNAGALAGKSKRLNLKFRFKPSSEDPAGVSGIKLMVHDEVSDGDLILVPTYDWRGGRP